MSHRSQKRTAYSVYSLAVQSSLVNGVDAYPDDLGNLAILEAFRSGIIDQAKTKDEVVTRSDLPMFIEDRIGYSQGERTRDIGCYFEDVLLRRYLIDLGQDAFCQGCFRFTSRPGISGSGVIT